MKVKVKLYNEFKQYGQDDKNVFFMELEPETSVTQLLADLHIPPTVKRVVLINGRRAVEDKRLSPNDTVVLFSPVVGG